MPYLSTIQQHMVCGSEQLMELMHTHRKGCQTYKFTRAAVATRGCCGDKARTWSLAAGFGVALSAAALIGSPCCILMDSVPEVGTCSPASQEGRRKHAALHLTVLSRVVGMHTLSKQLSKTVD